MKKTYKKKPNYPLRTPLLPFLADAAKMENSTIRDYIHRLLEIDLREKKLIK